MEWAATLNNFLQHNLGPVHIGVPSAQHGGEVPTFESQETMRIWLVFFCIKVAVWVVLCKVVHGTRVESWV